MWVCFFSSRRRHTRWTGDWSSDVCSSDLEPGPDLEHDVVAVELGEAADHAEDVLVDQEVLAELFLRPDAHGRPNASVAFASICAPRASAYSPRASARAATVWTTYAGSFVFPRTGCGAR